MTEGDDWKRVDSLFDAALDVPPAQRDQWLRQQCGGNEALRQRLDGHLAAQHAIERAVHAAHAARAQQAADLVAPQPLSRAQRPARARRAQGQPQLGGDGLVHGPGGGQGVRVVLGEAQQ
ncbi:MAG TPA: hypothetical protein VFO85_04835, partial [Vicinamibacteria bacterium]|nr:hypothetical protein [Vicinamibacteria bacterium]